MVPNSRIVMASTMALTDTPMSASLATFEILEADKGADLVFTHQGAFLKTPMVPRCARRAGRIRSNKLAEQV